MPKNPCQATAGNCCKPRDADSLAQEMKPSKDVTKNSVGRETLKSEYNAAGVIHR